MSETSTPVIRHFDARAWSWDRRYKDRASTRLFHEQRRQSLLEAAGWRVSGCTPGRFGRAAR